MSTYDWCGDALFASLVGATFTSIEGMTSGSVEVRFTCADGRQFRMYHEQDCCESVALDDVAGEVDDLLNSPLLMAEVVSGGDVPESVQAARDKAKADAETGSGYYFQPDSETWTYYKLATVKGYVTLRWLGESNGYYSESVTFAEVQ